MWTWLAPEYTAILVPLDLQTAVQSDVTISSDTKQNAASFT